MTGNFGAEYAAVYDVLHADKDYVVECDLIAGSFRRFSRRSVESILDLGCGTGSHARLLAGHGYRIAAVDRSAGMLEIARKKVDSPLVRYVQADIREMDLQERFDGAILMFAVLGYFTRRDDAQAVLSNVRRHLQDGAVLCFDFWYGPAVEAIRPSDRVRTVETAAGPLTRRVSGTIFEEKRVCEVRYDLERAGLPAGSETHTIRYFFEDELRELLSSAGFDVVSLTAFPLADRPPDPSTWNAFCVARAREGAGSPG